MTTSEIMAELKKAGSEATKKVLSRHGACEPFYGVKVEDMKKIMKKVKDNRQEIAMELFATGVGDAMYLAALMADGSKMKKEQLEEWAKKAHYPMISEYSVAWVASEHEQAFDLALKWIDSPKENIASSGWSTLTSVMATRPDEQLDIPALKNLLKRVEKEIFSAPNRVRYCMNGFVIAVGSFVKSLNEEAVAVGKKIGEVEVNMGETSCKVPYAPAYIQKIMDKGYLGKKKKTAKC